jgi:hypothetical protein
MTKIAALFLLVTFLVLVQSQPGPRVDINGIIYISYVTNWACTITFNSRGVPLYTESLSYSNTYNDNHVMSDSNILDSINWAGTSCNCWVVVFEHAEFQGDSTGFWIQNTTGTIDLTFYNFLQDGDLIGDDDYDQWNTAISSYRIYCY